MADQDIPSRRKFVKLCAAAVAAVSSSSCMLTRETETLQRFHRARLVDFKGRPITVEQLDVGQSYIFHYPYVSAPCFLLNLDRSAKGGTPLRTESGQEYNWQGGVGPQHSVVAFSAICAHRMNYPAPQVSFINYRHDETAFRDKDEQTVSQSQVIYCCSEKSVYDPTDGARVLGGPAPQPLAAIKLEYDYDDDTLHAVGAYGGQLFERFVEEFSLKLILELGRTDVDTLIKDSTKVFPLEHYTRNQILC
jgi:arsenite oxidase small subunit